MEQREFYPTSTNCPLAHSHAVMSHRPEWLCRATVITAPVCFTFVPFTVNVIVAGTTT